MPTGPETLVELKGAQRKFGETVAVDDLNLDVRRGEILGLYGPSGSGKTTTIRMILGVHLPTAGTVRILGVPSHSLSARQREQIGYSPQEFLYPPTFSAHETLALAAGLYGVNPFRTGRAIRSVLERVDLWDKRGSRVGSMSGGERRRVANAAALVHRPRITLLDEPTAGLDPILRTRMWDWFRALRDEGSTLVISGHYMAEAELCDRLALLVGGRLTNLGTPDELRRQALGGELIEVEVTGSISRAIDMLNEDASIEAVEVRDRTHLWLTVSDAGSAVPAIVDRFRESNIALTSINEFRPPFDDIFERLVTNNA